MIMKQTYRKPDTIVVYLELQKMIALSKVDGDANPSGEVLSRRRNTWYDDDDDE